MIFNFYKTKIRLSFSFVALTVTMILLCDEKIVLSSLLSSVVHECGHLFFMYMSGNLPEKIELTLFGMRINRIEKAGLSYKNEILIALGGIIFNFVFALIFYLLYIISDIYDLLIIAAVNLIVALVNSFPVSFLDSGRAAKYFIKYKDINEAYFEILSMVFLVAFTALTCIHIIYYGLNISLIAVNLYLVFITLVKKWS